MYIDPDDWSERGSGRRGSGLKNVIFALFVLTLGAFTFFLAYRHIFAPGGGTSEGELSGEWAAELDVTERAAAKALDWLGDIEAVTVSLEDMELYMKRLTVRVDLSFEQTGHSEGTFRCGVVKGSYESCRQAAYEAFAEAFRELLAERLRMAGWEGGTDRESVEALVAESFGMSTVSYLMTCGPALLPSLEELQSRYDGSGTYEVSGDILLRRFDTESSDASREERFVRKGAVLILYGESASDAPGPFWERYPVMYTLKQTREPAAAGLTEK